MDGQKVTTVAELEAMTPAERQASFEASIVRDLSQPPPAYVARLRARVEALADQDVQNAS